MFFINGVVRAWAPDANLAPNKGRPNSQFLPICRFEESFGSGILQSNDIELIRWPSPCSLRGITGSYRLVIREPVESSKFCEVPIRCWTNFWIFCQFIFISIRCMLWNKKQSLSCNHTNSSQPFALFTRLYCPILLDTHSFNKSIFSIFNIFYEALCSQSYKAVDLCYFRSSCYDAPLIFDRRTWLRFDYCSWMITEVLVSVL